MNIPLITQLYGRTMYEMWSKAECTLGIHTQIRTSLSLTLSCIIIFKMEPETVGTRQRFEYSVCELLPCPSPPPYLPLTTTLGIQHWNRLSDKYQIPWIRYHGYSSPLAECWEVFWQHTCTKHQQRWRPLIYSVLKAYRKQTEHRE